MTRKDNLTSTPTELEINVAKLYGAGACADCESDIAWDDHCCMEDVYASTALDDSCAGGSLD